MKCVVLGLTLSSSWGNGHATTWRSLLRSFAARGHDILFLERNVPWYAAARDLEAPDFCTLAFYESLADLERFAADVRCADAIIVGSFVPEGIAVIDWVLSTTRATRAFYDIDTPATLASLSRGTCAYLARSQIPRFDVYLSFTAGPTLARLVRDFDACEARALYCSVDDAVYVPRASPIRWDLGYLGTYSADRMPALERLLIEPARRAPRARFVVAGAQYPKALVWPDNVERLEHVPPHEHAAFYAAQRWTLNLTRADMRAAGYSPSVRLFEAASTATPIVSDDWPGLATLFTPDKDIAVATTSEDVLSILRRPETARRIMAAAARARVLANHTARHRAGELEAALSAKMGAREQSARRGLSTGHGTY